MLIDVNITPPARVEKDWGFELWIHNDSDYCGKLLVFSQKHNRFSMHYHLKKKETWYVNYGSFAFIWIDVESGKWHGKELSVGDTVLIERGLPHQLIALEDNSTVFEVSTEHFDDDSYRIYKKFPEELPSIVNELNLINYDCKKG